MNNLFAKLHQRQAQRREAFKHGNRHFHAFEGRQAFEKGTCPTMCPYALGTDEQRAWMVGWVTGFDKKFGGWQNA